jgi:hypothetical protein
MARAFMSGSGRERTVTTIITTTIGIDQAKGRPFWLPFQT